MINIYKFVTIPLKTSNKTCTWLVKIAGLRDTISAELSNKAWDWSSFFWVPDHVVGDREALKPREQTAYSKGLLLSTELEQTDFDSDTLQAAIIPNSFVEEF